MSFTLRRAALSTAAAAILAAFLPAACSSKAPTAEPKISGCMSDGECVAGQHCTNGVCRPNCVVANNDCPTGQTCGTDGRCSSGGNGGTGGTSDGGGTAGTIHIDASPDGSTDDGSLDPDAACGTGSATASLVPVSMFVMFDRSGSMLTDDVPNRWDNAALALTTFFQDPGAADLAVALRFFPHDQPAVGCTNNSMTGCIATDCAQPLIPLMADPLTLLPKLTADPGPMDAHEAALVASITASVPVMGGGNMSGGTPTSVALEGAHTWAAAYQTAHPRPEQQTVVVFVTDGEPNGCEEDTDAIAQIAANALAAPTNVRTFVVGLTDDAQDLAFLEDLATAGGTAPAFIVLDGATAAMDLATALKAIQGAAISCNFPYPVVADGGMADPARINVDYTPGVAGSMPVPFFRVADAAACPLDQPGWYYDNPTAPTEIILCPAACTTVTADPAAKLDIQIGCTSRDPPVM
jgi:hypothetical protein